MSLERTAPKENTIRGVWKLKSFVLSGEGVIGLTRAFVYAGASSVLVSLWNVNDVATAELMRSFYQNLSRGLSKEEGLRQAKLSFLRGHQSSWKTPLLLGSFRTDGPLSFTARKPSVAAA
jgi:CHAT domain-containing protein